MDFEDLSDDKKIQSKLLNFQESINKIEKMLEFAFNDDIKKDLTIKDQLNYDLFIAYTLSTLFYLYLRCNGQDPNKNEIKKELIRVKEYMVQAKNAIERHTLRQKVDVPAAARFIKGGLGISSKKGKNVESGEPSSKKQKLS